MLCHLVKMELIYYYFQNAFGKGHDLSLASLGNQRAIASSTQQVVDSLQTTFPEKPIFVFEHGPGFIEEEPIACGGCHMDHAHGHFVVLPKGTQFADLVAKTEDQLELGGWNNPARYRQEGGTPFTDIMGVSGLNPYLQMGLIIGNQVRTITYVQKSRENYVESQLLRKVIAEVVYNKPESSYWHWRDIAEGFSSKERIAKLKEDVLSFRAKIS